jgi:hypothetical protein
MTRTNLEAEETRMEKMTMNTPTPAQMNEA